MNDLPAGFWAALTDALRNAPLLPADDMSNDPEPLA